MEAALKQLEEMAADFETIRERLSPEMSQDEFLSVVQYYEKINVQAYRVYGFASLQFAADTQDQVALAFMARIEQFLTELQNRTLFFSLWWKGLDDGPAGRFMAVSSDYRYWLEEMRHFKEHTLTELEEKIVNIKNVTGSSALGTLYDTITNRYVYKVEVDGEIQELTRGELMVYARHYDPVLRERAYQELYRVYGDDGPVLGLIYQTLVRDWANEQLNLRRFSSPIAARNLINDIPDQVVDTLLEVCQNKCLGFPALLPLEGPTVRHGPPAPLRRLRTGC